MTIIGVDKLTDIQQLDYDLVVVDTTPYLSNRLPELFRYSDFILVPTKAGFFDVMAIRSTLALIKEAQLHAPDMKAAIVFNMVKPRSGITQEVADLLRSLDTPLLTTRIYDRVSMARSSMTGGILNSGDKKAKEEMMALTEEVDRIAS